MKKLLLSLIDILFQLLYGLLRNLNYYKDYSYISNRSEREALASTTMVNFDQAELEFLSTCSQSNNFIADDYALGYRQHELYLIVLENISFLGNTGAIIQDGKLIVESLFNLGRLSMSQSYRAPSFLLARKYRGFYTSILHEWAQESIYHWVVDCLPRVYLLVRSVKHPVKILMWETAHRYQKETLQFLIKENPNLEIQYIRRFEKIQIEKFIFPSFVSKSVSGYLPFEISSWMKKLIWEGYEVNHAGKFRKIYISRAEAGRRRILNEQELMPFLHKYNFEVVFAEKLTFREQVQLFYEAHYVVAPHGAGLTNLLFSQKCKVLELHPSNLLKPHYLLLCKGLRYDYSAMVGTVGNDKEDFSINPLHVEQWLQNTE